MLKTYRERETFDFKPTLKSNYSGKCETKLIAYKTQ